MSMESINLGNMTQPIQAQNLSSTGTTASTQAFSKVAESIQQVKQHMQLDPGYQPTFQEKTLLNAIEEVNTKLAGQNTKVEVSFHEKTKEPIIKLVNTESKETIREIPSEKIIDMITSLCEMAGLYVDEKR